ncbi:hypothetical protein C8R44DRAFT_754428 [Mycena epipterygia]|nr:hypothetical protein C8R44DRAFT_754428 [Mycena epipterygia]
MGSPENDKATPSRRVLVKLMRLGLNMNKLRRDVRIEAINAPITWTPPQQIFRRRRPLARTIVFLDLPEDVMYCPLCLKYPPSYVLASLTGANHYYSPRRTRSAASGTRRPIFCHGYTVDDNTKFGGSREALGDLGGLKDERRILKHEGVLHLPIRPAVLLEPSPFAVLGGGKYILSFFFVASQNIKGLGCWVVDDSFSGMYRSALPSHNIRDFEAEVLDGGEHANSVLYVGKETLDPIGPEPGREKWTEFPSGTHPRLLDSRLDFRHAPRDQARRHHLSFWFMDTGGTIQYGQSCATSSAYERCRGKGVSAQENG